MKKYLIIFLILLIPIGLIVNANAILVVEGTNVILAQTGLDEILASTKVRGYDGTNFGDMVGGMFIKASQAFTSSAQGIYIVFQTTPLNSIIPVDVFKINSDGSIGINQTKLCFDSLDCSGNDYIISYSNGNNTIYSAGNKIQFPNSTGTLALAGGSSALDDLTDVLITSPSYPSILSYDGSQWIDKVFAINNQSASNDVFITGINNQTGVITTNTFSVNTKTCSGTDKVSAIDNSTGDVVCSTDQTGGGGGMTIMKKTADQTINAGAAVYTNITDLSFPVTNGVDYAFHYYIVFRSSATATGFKCSVNGPAGTVDYFMTYQTVANAASGAAGVATWLQAHQIVYDAGFLNLTTITANEDLVCIIDGRYKSTANGTFTARFANELAANTNIVVQKGSYGWWF